MVSVLPDFFRDLFWDADFRSVDPEENCRFIIERVLNSGDQDHLAWIWGYYPLERIERVVRESRRLSPKTARCWQNYFSLGEEEMQCFGTYSMSPDGYY